SVGNARLLGYSGSRLVSGCVLGNRAFSQSNCCPAMLPETAVVCCCVASAEECTPTLSLPALQFGCDQLNFWTYIVLRLQLPIVVSVRERESQFTGLRAVSTRHADPVGIAHLTSRVRPGGNVKVVSIRLGSSCVAIG